MKKGFTLAEAIITLMILGVIAALTIPRLVVSYQKRVYYTQFMKSFNVLEDAYKMSVLHNGAPETWTWVKGNEEFVKTHFANYLKVEKYCTGKPTICGITKNTVRKFLNGTVDKNYYSNTASSTSVFVLQDGSIVGVYTGGKGTNNNPYYFSISVDVNGNSRGPNTCGRDVFVFRIAKTSISGRYNFYPYNSYAKTNVIESNCSKETTSCEFCAAKLFLEGKMNY